MKQDEEVEKVDKEVEKKAFREKEQHMKRSQERKEIAFGGKQKEKLLAKNLEHTI